MEDQTADSSTKLSNHILLYSAAKNIKESDQTNASNYRPISILQTLSNILERAVHFQLYDYLNIKHFLTDKQFGFRPKHETVTALPSFADGVLGNMERGNLCEGVFLDL